MQNNFKRTHDSKLVFGYIQQFLQKYNKKQKQPQFASYTTKNIPIEIKQLCFVYFYLNLYEFAYNMNVDDDGNGGESDNNIDDSNNSNNSINRHHHSPQCSWDSWDLTSMHSAMFLDPENDAILFRRSGGLNPYSFGTQIIESGITLWKFKVVAPTVYWIGILDAEQCVANTEECEKKMYFYSVDVDGGEINYTLNDGKRVRKKNEALQFGNFQGYIACMCLEYEHSHSSVDSTRNENADASASASASAPAIAIKLSFSNNKADFIEICRTVHPERRYKMCVSQRTGAKIQLLASAHFA